MHKSYSLLFLLSFISISCTKDNSSTVVLKEYSPSGLLQTVTEYSPNGKRNGLQRIYADDGGIDQVVCYKNDILQWGNRYPLDDFSWGKTVCQEGHPCIYQMFDAQGMLFQWGEIR